MNFSFETPDQPEVLALIEQLDNYQRPLYPAESHHGVSVESLCQRHVIFAVARNDEGEVVACGAIVVGTQFGELKRMYTAPTYRGQGIAQQLLIFLEKAASRRGCTRFMLETGYLQRDAIRFYGRSGYKYRGSFGNYTDDPNSVFMEKSI